MASERFALCIPGAPAEDVVTTVALLTAEQITAIIETAVTRALSVKSDESEILTREQVAEMLKVHPVTVTQYAKKKGLRGIQLTGGDWRFRRSDVDAWLQQRATEGK
jgi:excisionase family DNA binding protein